MTIPPSARHAADRAFASLDRSPILPELRRRAAWFASPVFWHPSPIDREELVRQLAAMRQAGFNTVRFHDHLHVGLGADGRWDLGWGRSWLDAASEAGIGVILDHLGNGPDPASLAAQGWDRATFDRADPGDARLVATVRDWLRPVIGAFRGHPALFAWQGFGEPPVGRNQLKGDADRAAFTAWLLRQHGDLAGIERAWNLYPGPGREMVRGLDDIPRIIAASSPDPEINGVHHSRICYGAMRDLARWHTERGLERTRRILAIVSELDPAHPVLPGTHQLFVNQAECLWDAPALARLGDGITTSIHLSWHFEPVRGEVDRPVHMQARQTRDYRKGGWSSCHETTGGPVHLSGGFGNHMDAALMRRLTLSYLAAGNLAMGFWTWNARPGGWESGEYGMIGVSGQVTPWALEAGRVAQALGRHAAELWAADHEPVVGLIEDWDAQAICALEPERDDCQDPPHHRVRGTRQLPRLAMIGTARACLDRGLPYEHVTTAELAEAPDLAFRYPCLVAPHLRAISDAALARLEAYVRGGGRLVADVSFAWLDPWGLLRRRGPGTALERLFGGWVDAIHDNRTGDRAYAGHRLPGLTGELVATSAEVAVRDDAGAPLALRHRLGDGCAILLACDPGVANVRQPGDPVLAGLLADLAGGGLAPGWRSSLPMTFRRRSPAADHWFLFNDGAQATAFITTDADYTAVEDAMTGEVIGMDGRQLTVPVAQRSARWLRARR